MALIGDARKIELIYQNKVREALALLDAGPSDNQTEEQHDHAFSCAIYKAHDERDVMLEALYTLKRTGVLREDGPAVVKIRIFTAD